MSLPEAARIPRARAMRQRWPPDQSAARSVTGTFRTLVRGFYEVGSARVRGIGGCVWIRDASGPVTAAS
jgi:hypothetical protein